MQDLFELIVGLLVCLLPLALIVGVVVLATRSGRGKRDEQWFAAVEVELWKLRGENTTLAQRVSQLEGALRSLQQGAPTALAEPPPVAIEERTTIPDGTAEARAESAAPAESAAWAESAAPEPASAPEAPPAHAPAAAPPVVWPAADAAQPEGVQPPPAPPSPPVPPTPPPAAPPERIAWERWIGVRGAAALGASILVLAGIYFFEYSIEHGLITPAMRMIAGTLVGLGCVLASELRLRRTHPVLASWIGGAGIAILYVAFWAGRALYDLYPSWAAGGLMVAVTGTCVALALKRESPTIAVLGLLGGFITPLALSTGSDQPIPLFSYILLLDGAMLWLAYKRRWAWMALLCLGLTALYQNAWLLARLDEPRLVLGVVIALVFAVLFAALPKSLPKGAERDEGESPLWKLARSAGVLLPLLFTIPLAVRDDLGATFWPTAAQLVVLCIAACAVGMRHRSALLPSGAALLAVGTLLGWALAHDLDGAREVWQLTGLALVIAMVFAGAAEIDRARFGGGVGPMPAWLVVLSILAVAALGAPFALAGGLWPWLALWAGLAAMAMRLGALPDRAPLQLAAAALGALGLGVTFAAGAGGASMPAGGLFLGIVVAFAAAMQLGGFVRRDRVARRFGDHAAALYALALVPLVASVIDDRALPVWAFYAGTIVLVVLGLLAAARAGASFWLPLALVASGFAHGLWIVRREAGPFDPLELGLLFAAVLVLSLWPIIAPRTTREAPWAWRTAALAGPIYLLPLRHVWLDVLGDGAIGALALALALLSIGAATAVRALGPRSAEARRVAMVWLTATAAGFVTLAIPLQLEQEWITIGWALEALALTVLWRRFDHAGLKYLAFALAAVVCVRLVLNPYVLGYYERSPLRIFNWLSYTYLVPAASLLGIWGLLRSLEIPRRRPWEDSLFPKKHALLANVAAAAALAVLFAWVNLTIIDWFATGSSLSIPTDRLPARDLTMSIAWAVFALVMLGLGLWRRSIGLRVASLGLILVTCGKVFLYDLAHLSDLYRVASLVGLALSLIVISLVYQRFVFRTTEAAR